MHKKLAGSLFSEQELVGLSNMLITNAKQKHIAYLRWGTKGKLNKLQMLYLGLLGFKHITYESPDTLLKRSQRWSDLIQHAFVERRRYRNQLTKIS